MGHVGFVFFSEWANCVFFFASPGPRPGVNVGSTSPGAFARWGCLNLRI
jgi:hypothetical protein